MERLTERIKRPQKDDLIVYTNGKYEDTIPAEMTNDDIRAVLKKLAYYEDLEDQGLLVRLPCKVGDTMYDIVGKPLRIVEHKVDAFHIDKKGFHLQIIDGVLEKKQEAKVYFSREEAEKKMEERKNEI